jgi:Rrf2 family protein
MRISTRGEYGLRALIELGMEPDKGLPLRDISQRQHISLDYLEQIVPALKAAGLVRSRRGAQGGYQLAKPADEITIYEAMIALEGPFDPMLCLTQSPDAAAIGCLASGSCAVQEVWQEMKSAVENVLKKMTLGELIQRQRQRYGVPIRTYNEEEIIPLVALN